MDDKLKTLLADPVAAAVRFEVVNQEIDWFDLRIVIDVEGVQLSKEQIPRPGRRQRRLRPHGRRRMDAPGN